MKIKLLTVSLCIAGLLLASFGMTKGDDILFIIGIVFIITGYLVIRRMLKKSIREKD